VLAARTLVLVPLVALLAVLASWHALRLSAGTAVLATALCTAPWLLLLPGLLARRATARGLAILLTLPYLAYAVMELLANPAVHGFATATLALALALFVALAMTFRQNRAA
jgi:uncharacterized membrane protein